MTPGGTSVRSRFWLPGLAAWVIPCVGMLGCATGSSNQAADRSVAPQVVDEPLAPGDMIRLNFWREPDLTGEFQIDETGNVVLPLLGMRDVTGMPATELRRLLNEDYQQELANEGVQIELLRRVRVLGAVNEPGLYHVDGTMSLGDAIALAGGATDRGKLRDIRIFRDGEEVLSDLDVSASVAEQVRSGDQINVPERSFLSLNGGIIIGSLITATAWIVLALSR